MNNKNDYEDILDSIWPQGKITSKMPLQSRAKIFLPFFNAKTKLFHKTAESGQM